MDALSETERLELRPGSGHLMLMAGMGLTGAAMAAVAVLPGGAAGAEPAVVALAAVVLAAGVVPGGLAAYWLISGRPWVVLTEDGLIDHRLEARLRGRTFVPWDEVAGLSRGYSAYGAPVARLRLCRGGAPVRVGLSGHGTLPGALYDLLQRQVGRHRRTPAPRLALRGPGPSSALANRRA